jgi:hypothetical protein
MRDEQSNRHVHLAGGLYERLVSVELQEQLDAAAHEQDFSMSEVDADEVHAALAQYLEDVVARFLVQLRGKDAGERQRRVANKLLRVLAQEFEIDSPEALELAKPLKRLLTVDAVRRSNAGERPDTPLSRTALLTGTRIDPGLGVQLRKEMASADRVDILCSFIKWSGLARTACLPVGAHTDTCPAGSRHPCGSLGRARSVHPR